VAIGHAPATGCSRTIWKELDDGGYIVVEPGTQDGNPGVFACEDVMNQIYRRAVGGRYGAAWPRSTPSASCE
jgi:thioredoxin reductase (NADPH)